MAEKKRDFEDTCKRAYLLYGTVPMAFKIAIQPIFNEILELAEEHEVPPDALITAIAALAASVAITNCERHDETTIDDRLYLNYCGGHAAAAAMRINRGDFPQLKRQ